MTIDWTPIVIAEAVLLLVGAALLIGGAVRATMQRRWKSLLELPAVTASPIQPMDPAIALVIMWLMPQLAVVAIGAGATPSAPGPETMVSEPDVPDTVQVYAVGIGMLVATAMILTWGAARFRGNLNAWGLSAARLPLRIGQALVAYIGIWPVCFGVLHLTVFLMQLADPDYVPPEHQTIESLLSGEHARLAVAVMAVNASLIAPLVEEMLFRGLLQPVIASAARSQWVAVGMTAAAFGVFHYPLVHTIPALATFGLLLGYLYARTGSLTLVVLLHAIFNGKTLLWLALSGGPT